MSFIGEPDPTSPGHALASEPDKVALALLGGFFVMAPAIGMSPGEIAMHLGASAAVLTFAFGCFSFGWIGGGNAKLVAATASWLGFRDLLSYLYMASLPGGGLTLLPLQFRMIRLPNPLKGRRWAERLHSRTPGSLTASPRSRCLDRLSDTIWMKPFSG